MFQKLYQFLASAKSSHTDVNVCTALQESKSESEGETPEPSSLQSAIGLGNPTIPCSTSTSISSDGALHKDLDVSVALPTVQKHRMPCML